jgi:Acetoacetate decarboxylase (ADC)
MEITHEFTDALFDNADKFSHEFFKRFELRKRFEPLQLNDAISKDYLFPTLYGDVECAIGIFLCDYTEAKKLLPHPSMEPVSMLGGRSLVIFSNYVYRNVLGIPSYNEIAATIPVMVDATFRPPLLPMVIDKFSKFGYHVFHMPVTSVENRIRGRKMWGLPKVEERIDIKVSGTNCRTQAYADTGEMYFQCDIPTTGKDEHFDVSSNLYSYLNKELLQSATHFKGDFKVNKHMDKLFKKSGANEKPALQIFGNSPMAQTLRQLNIDTSPFQTRYTASMNACFDLHNDDYQTPAG